MKPTTLPDTSKSRPTSKWAWRIVLATVAATLAWWCTGKLVRPQPLFSIQLEAGHTVTNAMLVGNWCLFNDYFQGGIRPVISQSVYDLQTRTCSQFDRRFGVHYPWMGDGLPNLRGVQDRWVLQFHADRSFDLYDTLDGSKTTHHFHPSSTLQLSEDGSTLVQTTTLPMGTWAGLAPFGWPGLTTALLTTCDAQRVIPTVIGPTLVQVYRLPDLTITNRYALPASVVYRFPKLSANGRYLIHGFTASSPVYFNMARDWQKMPEFTRKQWEDALLIFPEYGDYYRRWLQENPNKAVDAESRVWPELPASLEVYDTQSGNRLYTTQLEEDGKPVQYRCMLHDQDWVFISTIRPVPGNLATYRSLPRLCALHVPTGRKIAASELPTAFWENARTMAPTQFPGQSISYVSAYVGQPNPHKRLFRSSDPRVLYRFEPEGTTHLVSEYPSHVSINLVPHSNQAVVQETWRWPLPDWLTGQLRKWSWFNARLDASSLSVIDTESLSTLWTVPIAHYDIVFGPSHCVSRDGRLLFVPAEMNDQQVNYEAFSLPLSPWLPWWPRWAGLLTLVLVVSQGFRRLRLWERATR